jgi:hypothetical protein
VPVECLTAVPRDDEDNRSEDHVNIGGSKRKLDDGIPSTSGGGGHDWLHCTDTSIGYAWRGKELVVRIPLAVRTHLYQLLYCIQTSVE